jgi:hypothetical protein
MTFVAPVHETDALWHRVLVHLVRVRCSPRVQRRGGEEKANESDEEERCEPRSLLLSKYLLGLP